MSFENITQVKEAHTAKEANLMLDQGWKLLGFVESTKDGGVTYVLGQSGAGTSAEVLQSGFKTFDRE